MDLKLPNLGEGADSGTVVNVFVKEGEQIAKDQALLELENEKAVATIPASAAGTIAKIHVKAGDKLSVGQRILTLAGGEEAGAPAAARKPGPREEAQRPQVIHIPRPEPEEDCSVPEPGAAAPAAAPSIRKMARELGIDLTKVRGSARGGRIVLEDLRAHIQRLQRLAAEPKAPAIPGQPAPRTAETVDFSQWGPVTRKPLSPLRQVIARRMWENWSVVPHVTQFEEIDITTLNEWRKQHAAAYEKAGARLTLTGFVLKIVVETLKHHPVFNSSLDEAAQEIVYKDYYHLGVAVDTEAGLIVPVIRDVDRKSVLDLSRELEALAKKARDRKVSAEELKGGTFTISNQGGIGGGHFTPIVNKPEVAILGLGRGALKPVVREGKIEPRLLLPVALSYDHRVIDGGAAARFIVDLTREFQNFKETAVRL